MVIVAVGTDGEVVIDLEVPQLDPGSGFSISGEHGEGDIIVSRESVQ